MLRALVLSLGLLTPACATAPAVHEHGVAEPLPATGAILQVTGPAGQLSFSAADIAALPHVSVNAEFHGERHVFEGVLVTTLVARVGAPTGDRLRAKELDHVVLAIARDGYRVALSLAETDAGVTPRKVIIADKADGQPIPETEGPFRLVVEGDLKPARSARMLAALEVRKLN